MYNFCSLFVHYWKFGLNRAPASPPSSPVLLLTTGRPPAPITRTPTTACWCCCSCCTSSCWHPPPSALPSTSTANLWTADQHLSLPIFCEISPLWKKHEALGTHHPQHCYSPAQCRPCKEMQRCRKNQKTTFEVSFSYLLPWPLSRFLIKLPQLVDQGSPSWVGDWWHIIVVVLEIFNVIFDIHPTVDTSSLCRSSASEILWDTGILYLVLPSHMGNLKTYSILILVACFHSKSGNA